jgi:flavodoxin
MSAPGTSKKGNLMKTLIVYFSKFGNTRKIADAIAEILRSEGTTRVIPLDQLAVSDLNAADLVIMGSPTHKMNLPETVGAAFETLPRRILRSTAVAAFDTSYKMSWWLTGFTAAHRLARKLGKLGGKQVVPPETFHVVEREGPLYDGELERAKEWAAGILKRTAPQRI